MYVHLNGLAVWFYYEEIGLLSGACDRPQGKHRCYSETDVAPET